MGATKMEEGYDPEYLAVEEALGFRPGLSGSTAQEKAQQYNIILHGLAEQWPRDGPINTRDVSRINENSDARIYTPTNVTANATASTKLPVCVYIHGGGWIAGDLDCEDPQCRMIAESVPCVVVAFTYRLTPQNRMPIPIEDCVKGFEWAYSNAAEFYGDTDKYFICGGSAGGHLALAVTDRLVASGRRDQIKGTLANMPITCHRKGCPEKYKDVYKSYEENSDNVPIVDGPAMDSALESAGAAPDDATVFPVLSPNLAKWPPLWISTAGKDPLRDDGLIMQKALEEVGVKVQRVHYWGFPHYFFVLPMLGKSTVFMKDLNEGMKWILAQLR